MYGQIEETTLTNIANAIRKKNGTTTKYKPKEMAAAVLALDSGTADERTYTWEKYSVIRDYALVYSDELYNHTSVIRDTVPCATATPTATGVVLSDSGGYYGTEQIRWMRYPYYEYEGNVYKIINFSYKSYGGSVYDSCISKLVTSELADIKGDYIETVTSTNKNAYPLNGQSDVYWYVSLDNHEIELFDGYTRDYVNNDITAIRDYAFYNSGYMFNSVNCPNVESIGSYAFYGSAMTSMNFPKVKTIGDQAFYQVGNVTKVDFHNLESIGAGAFYKTGFHHFIIRTNKMCTAQSTSLYNYFNMSIYVPSALVATYQADSVWKSFSKVTFKAIEDYPDICGEG